MVIKNRCKFGGFYHILVSNWYQNWYQEISLARELLITIQVSHCKCEALFLLQKFKIEKGGHTLLKG